ncbi:MAG: HlyD family secretion protein [Chromatiaceae bacterium]|nr:HlyD family secretion protein [Gammaproteobacteria bacterium]MCP5314606.1 HlyD family secretion protein [Chromatiaceae bacterium]
MDLLLILTYAAFCVVVFKVFKVPLNKWTVPTAVLGGIVLIGTLLLLMNYNHPYSETVRQYYVTTPIISEVRGRVVEVPIRPNTPVKKGDILFQIDPEPFQEAVNGLDAELLAARKDLDRAEELFRKKVGSERAADEARARVDELQAKLADARFDLQQTIVTAPSDGVVTQLALRPGMMATPLAISPVMYFLHQEERIYFGWFRQNSLLRLIQGSEAELALDAVPGVIFKGRVREVLPAIAEGQVRPDANFIRFDQERSAGRVPVAIEITDPAFHEYTLPSGTFGQAAIYTDHFHHVGIMRKVLLRMAAWLNYVFPMH